MTEPFSSSQSSPQSPRQPSAAPDNRTWTISEADAGSRLDVFLAHHYTDVSRTFIRSQIVAGRVLVDGRRAKVAYRLHAGQLVEAFPFEQRPATPQAEDIPLDILFEDEDLAVVNKSAGMVVHPAKGHWSGTLTSALSFHFQSLSSVGGPTRPGIVHRLDRDTSGVILIAKNNKAHKNLAAQFEARTVQKEYWAIVHKIPDRDRDRIALPIGPHPHHREKMITGENIKQGKAAETFYEVLERFQGFALMRAVPKTGRTHQIRLHLTHLGHPVLCDKLYGSRSQISTADLPRSVEDDSASEQVLLDRQALHARKISITHPTTGAPLSFEAPLPEDFEKTLAALRKLDA